MGIFTGYIKKSLLCVINRSDLLKPMDSGHTVHPMDPPLTVLWFWSPIGVLLYRLYKVEDNETLRDFHTVFKLMFSSSMLVQINKTINMDFFLIWISRLQCQ